MTVTLPVPDRTARAPTALIFVAGLLLLALGSVTPAPRAAEGLVPRAERMAAQAARESVAPPDRFEVLSSRFAGAPRVDDAELELIAADGPNASGMVRVTYRMTVAGTPAGRARVTVRGRVLGPALVASRTIRRDTPLTDADLAVVETDLTRLVEPPLRSPAEAIGRVVVRTLAPGRTLTAQLIEPAPVVHRGEPVELLIRRDRVTVRAAGTALRSGAPGQSVPAVNDATGFRVEGIVQTDGTLLVERSSARRARS